MKWKQLYRSLKSNSPRVGRWLKRQKSKRTLRGRRLKVWVMSEQTQVETIALLQDWAEQIKTEQCEYCQAMDGNHEVGCPGPQEDPVDRHQPE